MPKLANTAPANHTATEAVPTMMPIASIMGELYRPNEMPGSVMPPVKIAGSSPRPSRRKV